MNIIYETTKERGATIPMPSSMVDSLDPSAATLALALAGQAAPSSGLVERPEPVAPRAVARTAPSAEKNVPQAVPEVALEAVGSQR